MPYRVMDLNTLHHMGRSAGVDESARLEEALNTLENNGWAVLHVMDQRQLWDEEGSPAGTSEVAFVFHKPLTGKEVFDRYVASEPWKR